MVIDQLRGDATFAASAVDAVATAPAATEPAEILCDDDRQLALWVLYELHYRGFNGVDDAVEWDPSMLRVRRELERPFEQALRQLTAAGVMRAMDRVDTFDDRLSEVIEDVDGPSLAGFVHRKATAEQVDELLIQRSLYHLKESDPQAFALPRLHGSAKVALSELLHDEFGAGRPEMLHSTLFARALRAAGLDDTYGSYIDCVPGYTLAVNNTMSLFGLHRRLLGASMGHLAAFEATSSLPCRHFSLGLERLGYDPEVRYYFDEHVEADAVHEHVAQIDVCGALATDHPDLATDILFGAASCGQLDRLVAEQMIGDWQADRSTLRSEPTVAA